MISNIIWACLETVDTTWMQLVIKTMISSKHIKKNWPVGPFASGCAETIYATCNKKNTW